MKEWEKQERSITLTNAEWCHVMVELEHAIESRKMLIDSLEIIDKKLAAAHQDGDSGKHWQKIIDASEKIIKKIECSI